MEFPLVQLSLVCGSQRALQCRLTDTDPQLLLEPPHGALHTCMKCAWPCSTPAFEFNMQYLEGPTW